MSEIANDEDFKFNNFGSFLLLLLEKDPTKRRNATEILRHDFMIKHEHQDWDVFKAIETKDENLLEELAEKFSINEIVDDHGRHPIVYTVINDAPKCLNICLKHSPNESLLDETMVESVRLGHTHIFDQLWESGVVKDCDGQVIAEAINPRSDKFVQKLLDYSENCRDFVDKQGKQLLQISLDLGNLNVAMAISKRVRTELSVTEVTEVEEASSFNLDADRDIWGKFEEFLKDNSLAQKPPCILTLSRVIREKVFTESDDARDLCETGDVETFGLFDWKEVSGHY